MGKVKRGVFGIDDELKFGQFVDDLSEFCYSIMYVPSKDYIVVSAHKKYKDKLNNYDVFDVKERGGLVFAKIRWRD